MKTEILDIDPVYPEEDKIKRCAKIIRQGGLVIFPTETVYGVAADLSNPQAMKRLREVKRRSDNKPFSLLVSQKGLIANYTSMTSPVLYKIIDKFWPGPLTLILPTGPNMKKNRAKIIKNMIAANPWIFRHSDCAGCVCGPYSVWTTAKVRK